MSYETLKTVVSVSILSLLILSLCDAMAEGPRIVLQKSGFLVDTDSDLTQCEVVKCVSGVNCSEESTMKCSKFTYCADVETLASSATSSDSGSQDVIYTEECTTGLAIGQECHNSTDCIDYWSGAYCSPSTHVCSRARVLNESCDKNVTCAFPLVCGDEGVCVSSFSLTVGRQCDLTKEPINGGCHLSLYCNSDVCVEFPGLGEPCNDTTGCALPYLCSSADHICVKAMSHDVGESCLTSLDCKENLICARNGTCVLPLDNYTYAVNCSSQDDCGETSYCHCDYVSGVSMCLPLPLSSNDTLELFNTLVACVNLDPDMSVSRCQAELVDVQRAINASAIIDFECSRIQPFDNAIDLLLLLVPVTILISILGLVLIVKLGIPSDK